MQAVKLICSTLLLLVFPAAPMWDTRSTMIKVQYVFNFDIDSLCYSDCLENFERLVLFVCRCLLILFAVIYRYSLTQAHF